MIIAVDDDGALKIGNPPESLPGLFVSISIDGQLKVDSANMAETTGSTKTIEGWEDSTVRFSGVIVDDEEKNVSRFDTLKKLTAFFNQNTGGKPVKYQISHPLLSAWNITEGYMQSLSTATDNKKKMISFDLTFVEENPLNRKKSERAQSKQSNGKVIIDKREQSDAKEKLTPDPKMQAEYSARVRDRSGIQ